MGRKIQVPICLLEFENFYRLEFVSEYEEWELDSTILDSFNDYEFTSNIYRDRTEIRLQISRYQSSLSSDNWGRPIENPLNETKYLVKKSDNQPEKINPNIKVLFGDSERDYFVNIVTGINHTTGENGFLLLDEFKIRNKEAEVLKDKLYKSPNEAFFSGYNKMRELVKSDFNDFIENKKKEARLQQKLPRKIIKEFITSCNQFNVEGICKNLDEEFVFEEFVKWQKVIETEGIQNFRNYLKSPDQVICSKDYRIRSSWSFNLPSVTIGLKFFPTHNEEGNESEQLERITFIFRNNKIQCIQLFK